MANHFIVFDFQGKQWTKSRLLLTVIYGKNYRECTSLKLLPCDILVVLVGNNFNKMYPIELLQRFQCGTISILGHNVSQIKQLIYICGIQWTFCVVVILYTNYFLLKLCSTKPQKITNSIALRTKLGKDNYVLIVLLFWLTYMKLSDIDLWTEHHIAFCWPPTLGYWK